MPFFKSTYNILVKPDEDEIFDPNWMDSDKLILPEKKYWDYKREMQIEDVDIWEQIHFDGQYGVYAAWSPYAEFYMITNLFNKDSSKRIKTFYGPKSSQMIIQECKKNNLNISINEIWVDDEYMWLF